MSAAESPSPIPTPEVFFLEVGLYDNIPLVSDEDITALGKIIEFTGKLETYCTGCKMDSIFQ